MDGGRHGPFYGSGNDGRRRRGRRRGLRRLILYRGVLWFIVAIFLDGGRCNFPTAGSFLLTYPCVLRVLRGFGLLFFLIEPRYSVGQPGRFQFSPTCGTAALPFPRSRIPGDITHAP